MQNKFEILQPEGIYHIYNRANGFENLFHNDENYRFFLQQWDRYISPIADTLCYCLMPNHFHFIIRIREENVLKEFFKEKLNKMRAKILQDAGQKTLQDAGQKTLQDQEKTLQGFGTLEEFDNKLLSQSFSHLFNGYTQALNKQQNRRGSLFMPSFKRKLIDNETYLINLFYYIHRNPVHHGFCSDFKDWKYSSFHRLISDNPGFVSQQAVFEYFSDKQNFIDSHEKIISLKEEYSLE